MTAAKSQDGAGAVIDAGAPLQLAVSASAKLPTLELTEIRKTVACMAF